MDIFSALKHTLKETCPQLILREEEPLSKHTMFRIGGPAALMAFPKTEAETKQAVQTGASLGLTPVFLGMGSNLLISDDGLRAFVIKLAGGLETIRRVDEETIEVGSGVPLSQAAVYAMKQGLAGMEFAHGIPGSVGGAVFMNAGAYGGEMEQIVTSVDCIELSGDCDVVSGEKLGFGYRCSAFTNEKRLIIGAKLHLRPGDPQEIQDKMMKLMEKRRSKQPLEYPSAGSTFKRPKDAFAGTLIEQCGLKGYQIGGAQVSQKHAGFIINTGGATCLDVLRLMQHVRDTVYRETGVLLEPEVRMLGCHL